MSFLQPVLLFGLLAAAVPVIIHLLNRRRHKTVMWAAMQFLLKATRESRGKKRLRHIIILTCRALGVAALATAAANPVLSGFLGWGGGRPDLVVLVFDRSASMEAIPQGGTVSRRELGLARVKNAMEELSGTRLVLIDSASGNPQEVPSPDVLGELAATAPTDTAADIPALAERAAEFLAENSGRAELWIVSDMQGSNWSPASERWLTARAALGALPQPPRLRILALTGRPSANQSVRILASQRAGDRLELDVEVSRGDDSLQEINLPLTSSLNGVRSTTNVTLSGQSIRFRKSLALPEGEGTGHGWISIPADGNPRDNVVFFAYGPDRPVKCLLVAPAGESADYVAIAAAPGNRDSRSIERIDPSQAAALDTTGVAAVFWLAPLPVGTTAEKLAAFISEGGEMVCFAPDQESDAEFLGVKWSPVSEAAAGKFHILGTWEHDEGLLRDGLDGSPIPAARLKAVLRRMPLGDAVTMANWDDGQPFLSRHILDSGTVWFVGSQPDYRWSNLGDADVLLPAAQRAVAAGAGRFDSGYLTTVGSRESLTPEGTTRLRIDGYGNAAAGNEMHEAGIHRIEDRLLALNRPISEDQPEVLTSEDRDRILEGTDFRLFEDRGTSGNDNATRQVWRAFLVAMLCFLIAEALLCLPKSQPVHAPKPIHPART